MKKTVFILFIILISVSAYPLKKQYDTAEIDTGTGKKVTVPTGEKMRIAILDFKGDGVAESMARRITELIRSEMINTGSYIVIERSYMDSILKEQSFQQAGCTDVGCAVEMGKLLSANKMLLGTIMNIGKKTVITGRIIDVQKGVAEFSQNQSVQSDDELFAAVSLFAKNLTLRIQGKSPSDTTDLSGTGASGLKKQRLVESGSGEPGQSGEAKASVNGKYHDLLQTVNCPADAKSYGEFYEWGFWSGTSWCGQKVQAGFWIWVSPNWYIWKSMKEE